MEALVQQLPRIILIAFFVYAAWFALRYAKQRDGYRIYKDHTRAEIGIRSLFLWKEFIFESVNYAQVMVSVGKPSKPSQRKSHYYLTSEILLEYGVRIKEVYKKFFGKECPQELVIRDNGKFMVYNLDTRECRLLKEDDTSLLLIIAANHP